MAEKGAETLAEGVKKELTCAICLSRFDHPKVLPCLHTYCKQCLENLVDKAREKGKITCPQCQEIHQVPANGISGFRTHFTCNNLLELLHIHDNTGGEHAEATVICESGLDEGPTVAHAHCWTCGDYLCESCYTIHTKQKATRDHQVKLLDEIKRSSLENGIKNIQRKKYCEEHKEEIIKLFCKTCQCVICRDCALVKHREHDYVFAQEVRQETQKKLEQLMDKVQTKETETQAHSDHVKKIQETNTKRLASVEQEIDEAFKQVLECLNLRKSELLAEIRQSHESEKKEIEAEADSVSLALIRLSHSLHFTCQLLDKGDDVEVMSMSKQAEQTLENLASIAWKEDSVKPTQLGVKFNPRAKEVLKMFGTVRFSNSTQPKRDIVIHDFPKEVSANRSFNFDVILTAKVVPKDSSLNISISSKLPQNSYSVSVEHTGKITWRVTCTLTLPGEHELTIRYGDLIPLTQAFQVKKSYKTIADFKDKEAYGRYVKSILKPGMRVRARVDFERVSKGDYGTYQLTSNSTATTISYIPPLPPTVAQFAWDGLNGDTYWVFWHQVELLPPGQ